MDIKDKPKLDLLINKLFLILIGVFIFSYSLQSLFQQIPLTLPIISNGIYFIISPDGILLNALRTTGVFLGVGLIIISFKKWE